MKKLFFVSFIAILILSLLFFACLPEQAERATPGFSNDETQTKPSSVPATKTSTPKSSITASPTTDAWKIEAGQLNGITLSVRHPWYGEASTLFEAIVESFNKTNEWGISVSALGGSGLEQVGELLAYDVLESDLVIAQSYDILSANAQNSFIELNDFIFHHELGLADLYANDSPFAHLSPLEKMEEEIIALPIAYQPALLFYNRAWAKEMGFAQLPLQLDAFQEQMLAGYKVNISDGDIYTNGTGGLWLSKSVQSAQAWYASFDGVFEPGSTHLQFDDERLLSTYQWLKEAYEANVSWVGMETIPYDYFARRLALSYEAALMDMDYQTAAMANNVFEDHWLSMPYPTEDGKGSIALESVGIGIKTSDKNTELAAWLLVRFLLEEAQQKALVDVHGFWPVIDAPAKIAFAYAEEHPAWASAVLPGVHFSLAPEAENWAITRRIFQDAYLRVYGLDAAYFPNIIDLLTQTLIDVQAGIDD